MDVMTESQLLILIICGVISLLAWKFKQPALALVSGAGIMVLAMQIYNQAAEPDLMLLAMMIFMAITQFVLVVSGAVHSRRR